MVTALLVSMVLAAEPFADMTDAERKTRMTSMTRDELDAALRVTPSSVLLGLSQKAVTALGTYQYVMKKRERVNGTLIEEQTVKCFVREKPSAIRLEYDKAPSAGRKVIYNASIEVRKLRAREAGILGIVGGIWLDIDAGPTRADSNHAITEAGLGALVKRLTADQKRAGAAIGVTHEGWKGDEFCTLFTLPKNQGFDHEQTRVCFNPKLGVPTLVEGFNAKNEMVERYAFSELAPFTPAETTFDPDKGL